MAASLNQMLTARREALLRHWAANPLIQVQAESPGVLGRLSYFDEPGDGGVARLGRAAVRNVALVTPPGDAVPHRRSLWVRARGYDGYRAAFRQFLKAVYGLDLPGTAIPGYDVDHLLNRARSPQGSTFVRVEAVRSEVNQAWGRLYEKAASKPEFHANRVRERRTRRWTVAAKVAGLMPPREADDAEGLRRVAAGLAAYGLSAAEAVEGLRSMLAFAAREPGA